LNVIFIHELVKKICLESVNFELCMSMFEMKNFPSDIFKKDEFRLSKLLCQIKNTSESISSSQELLIETEEPKSTNVKYQASPSLFILSNLES